MTDSTSAGTPQRRSEAKAGPDREAPLRLNRAKTRITIHNLDDNNQIVDTEVHDIDVADPQQAHAWARQLADGRAWSMTDAPDRSPQAEGDDRIDTARRTRIPQWARRAMALAVLGLVSFQASLNLAYWISVRVVTGLDEDDRRRGGSVIHTGPCLDGCGLPLASFSLNGLAIWTLVVATTAVTWWVLSYLRRTKEFR